MKIAIIIPTFRRIDGKTPELLKMTLGSIFKQTFQNYKIFLIGDDYDNQNEFEEFSNYFDFGDKLYSENVNLPSERNVFNNKIDIWKFGGVNAVNYGIDLATKYGYKYIARLDHDDLWLENHLELLNECLEITNCAFVCTKSNYGDTFLPKIKSEEKFIDYIPQPENVVHSSICWDATKIPVRYRTLGDSLCQNYAGDGCLYLDIRNHIQEKQLKSILINEVTCSKDSDGYFKNN